ncbi:MAG: hypothetical protein KAG96_01520 [Ichthyobacteriaceae bacterium]|nr:hypothetical protein [Ichthyobacteriaceae bacterium]
MKNIYSLRLIAFVVLLLTIGGCGNSKKKVIEETKKTVVIKKKVESTIPCAGTVYTTSNKYFRGNGSGESLDKITAERKALLNAHSNLSSQISATMHMAGERYMKTILKNYDNALDRFDEYSRLNVNKKLLNTKRICEKSDIIGATGKYKFSIAVEISSDEIIKYYSEFMLNDKSIGNNYSSSNFKRAVDAEMNKL